MRSLWLASALVIVLGVGVFAVTHAASAPTGAALSASSPTAHVQGALAQTAATRLRFTAINGANVFVNPNDKTVLHFMTSSCTACLPTEKTLAQFQHTPGVKLISLDVEPQADNAGTIQAFSHAAGSHWPYVLAANAALIQKFHVTALDTVVVLYQNRVLYDGVAPSAATLKKVLT